MTNPKKLPKTAALIALLALLSIRSHPAPAQAPMPALWQIGQADHSAKEFALAPDGLNRYKLDGFYVIGQSQSDLDWPYIQPGPEDAWAGSRSHMAQIEFALTQTAAQGNCRLTLSLADTQNRVPPQLQITVNGQSFTRDTTAGDPDDSRNGRPEHYIPSVVTVDFPASLLKTGINFVSITTVKGSWIIYDALTLTAPAGTTLGTAPPTVHLGAAEWLHDVLTRKNGALQQVLQLQISNFGPAQDAELRVSGEAARTVTLPSGRTTLTEEFPESQTAAQTQAQFFASG